MCQIWPWQPQAAVPFFQEARKILEADGLLALPTETFYALACHPFRPEALRRLFAVKARSPDKPILLLVADPGRVPEVAGDIPPLAKGLMARFWPGPLTLILPARPELSPLITGGTGTVGVRQPRQRATLALLRALDFPLTGTSANRAGEPPARTAMEVAQALGSELDGILDDGPCPGGVPSTVVNLTTQPPRLVRLGAVRLDELMELLPDLAATREAHG